MRVSACAAAATYGFLPGIKWHFFLLNHVFTIGWLNITLPRFGEGNLRLCFENINQITDINIPEQPKP